MFRDIRKRAGLSGTWAWIWLSGARSRAQAVMASEPRGAEYPVVAKLLNNGVLLKLFRCRYVFMWRTVWTTSDGMQV